jgi:hypothetical protein
VEGQPVPQLLHQITRSTQRLEAAVAAATSAAAIGDSSSGNTTSNITHVHVLHPYHLQLLHMPLTRAGVAYHHSIIY